MSKDLYLEANKSPLKTFLWVIRVTIWAFICFYISSILFLSLAHLIHYGFSKHNLYQISDFVVILCKNPLFMVEAYKEWVEVFSLSFKYSQLKFVSFLPMVPIILFFMIIFGAYVKSPHSFNLWYRLNNHYAKLEDVKSMGILKGSMMALGKFQGMILRLNRELSVFVWGAPGLGKTTTVAIPSILESDGANLVVAECSGALMKYTSGYRSQLGPVFYFNWALNDNPIKGEFWPRWNPLSPKDMPPKGDKRDKYIANLAKYLLPKGKESYWEMMAGVAMEGLLQFYSSKIDQACANDYFLSELLDKGKLSNEDKDILLSYYAMMPKKYANNAMENLKSGTLDMNNYLPIGSWEGVPSMWQGKEFSFAMFADCLIQRYFLIMQNDNPQKTGGWKILLGELLKEASFFGYNFRSIQIMQNIFYLSKKQRQIIFTIMLSPLEVFRKSSVRERTSVSDLSIVQVRGNKNSDGSLVATSIYMVSDNRASAFMTRFLVDMIIGSNLHENSQGLEENPILFVMDDFERLPKFSFLTEGLTHGLEKKMSFLILTDGLRNIQNNYGVDGLEDIISNASYKLMFAENNQRLSDNFNKLAIYGTKSVQIPAMDTGAFYKVKSGLADANYYHRIAKGLLRGKSFVVKKGQHLLLAEGFYHLPIRVNSMFFVKEEDLKAKATLEASYFLDEDFLSRRESQDMETPLLIEVLKEANISVEKEEDIDNYLEDKYDEMVENIQATPDKQSAMAEDISSRWKSNYKPEKSNNDPVQDDDWWMEEEAFSVADSTSNNPFDK